MDGDNDTPTAPHRKLLLHGGEIRISNIFLGGEGYWLSAFRFYFIIIYAHLSINKTVLFCGLGRGPERIRSSGTHEFGSELPGVLRFVQKRTTLVSEVHACVLVPVHAVVHR